MSGRKGGEAKVEQVAVEARRLVTIGVDSPYWYGMGLACSLVDMEGAIVRVQPPATATDAQIAEVGEFLIAAGAAKVRLDSRAQADALPATEQPRARASARAVVMDMAGQSRRVEALTQLLDLELAKVRL